MVDVIPLRALAPRKLSRQQFKMQVVALVQAGAVKISAHLTRDHPERAISQAQIERCLLNGTVQTDPFMNQFGNWQAEMFRHLAGQEMTVVVAIEWEKQVIVITAF